jgi:hypothetical protein
MGRISKRKKPVSIMEDGDPLFGRMKGSIRVIGDIMSPIGETWDVDGLLDSAVDVSSESMNLSLYS